MRKTFSQHSSPASIGTDKHTYAYINKEADKSFPDTGKRIITGLFDKDCNRK